MELEETWIERFRDVSSLAESTSDVLVGFNANIDMIYDAEDFGNRLEEAVSLEKNPVSGEKEMFGALKHAINNAENTEIDIERISDIPESGESRIGGQGGIMAKYLSAVGDAAVLYTPELSEKLSRLLGDRILYPVSENNLLLKNIEDSVNSSETKVNLIFEYGDEETGRVIFSSSINEFGPFFHGNVAEHLDEIDQNMDRILLSGFHDVEGNREAKLEKSRRQLEEIDTDIHHEYVHRPETAELIMEKIIPEVDSIGLDSRELRKISRLAGIESDVPEEPSLGDSFAAVKQLIEELDLQRVHIHTIKYSITVASKDYSFSTDEMLQGLVYGMLSGSEMCQSGEYPRISELQGFSMEGKHLEGVEELRDFKEFFNLEDFERTGKAEVDGYKIAAAPSLIVEEPEKLVGLGDVISCGSFVGEWKAGNE